MSRKLKIAVTYSSGDSEDSIRKTLSKQFEFAKVTNPKSSLRTKFNELEKQLETEIGDSFNNGQTSLEDE